MNRELSCMDGAELDRAGPRRWVTQLSQQPPFLTTLMLRCTGATQRHMGTPSSRNRKQHDELAARIVGTKQA
jgi:hypothetical protein